VEAITLTPEERERYVSAMCDDKTLRAPLEMQANCEKWKKIKPSAPAANN
jgi:hypothetical protein